MDFDAFQVYEKVYRIAGREVGMNVHRRVEGEFSVGKTKSINRSCAL